MVNSLRLQKGKTYRSLADNPRRVQFGMVMTVTSKIDTSADPPYISMDVVHSSNKHMKFVHVWWLYDYDWWEELTEEEVTMYKLGEGT